jgi:hypothetical protein
VRPAQEILIAPLLSPADELKCELAAEALLAFGSLRLQVTGCSMLPALWPHDVLTIRATPVGELKRGDLVAYRRGKSLCVHRLVQTAADAVVTRGDGLSGNDLPVSPDRILGRVVAFCRAGKDRVPKVRLSCTQRLLQFAIHRSGRFRALLLRLHALRLKLVAV